ncbi:hypothetical protein ASPSYDRAFT_157429 [Aspergillus sydowii CBS 593.65]|uniref:Uncharacterized protein n=1 Tax=Aspergillus sydowii CBS 593.65 TaxID=1036612 RepID=A0A1L9T9R2_9EURO|nr:uncharacterized protein ASPSYDRAFT_157429 [Aspergillus sydowii CBS 593.65]OJJ56152.1 hypothetical protein ASPSYDRAFT_157429 [Aspergillus sydowii CBS 593.65]
MDEVFNDPTVLDGYILEKNRLGARSIADIRIQALDWVDGADYPVAHSLSIGQLANSKPLLRIIFPQSARDDGLLWLVQHYSIPTAFLEGEYRAVTHSFGSLDTDDGHRCCWFNYLCKNITVIPGPEPVIADPRIKDSNAIRQSDFTWMKSAFFLRWPIDPTASPGISLICFGGHMVINRLQTLTYSAVKNGIIHDPLSLFVVILNRLSAHMNNAVWDLSKVFAGIETKALGLSHDRESFTGLHNISKHVIFLQESSEAALETVKNLSRHHEEVSPKATLEEQAAGRTTRRTIAQVEAEFKGVKLRLRSLDRRMQNVIALSFHLVTQEGNEFLQADSSTMATIAFVTLVFLPITTVSTIFGSQFFNVTDDNSAIEVSKDFWIFWVVSIPLTLIVLLGWTLWRKYGLVANHAAWMRALRPFAQEKGAN